MASEKTLQAFVKKECKAAGVLCYKFSSPSHRGVPDLILIGKQGRVIFVELKSPTGKGRLSPLQEHTIREIRNQKGTVYVASSKETVSTIIGLLAPDTGTARGD